MFSGAGLQHLTTTFQALAASLPALACAAALKTVEVECTGVADAEERLRSVQSTLRWAGRQPALRLLSLGIDDATLGRAAAAAVDALRPSAIHLEAAAPYGMFHHDHLRRLFDGPDLLS